MVSLQSKSMNSWFICCRRKDGSTSCEKFSDHKESHLVQVTEFETQMCVALEPGFNWWVFCVLKKRDAIISLLKCCNIKYLKKTYKCGLPLSKLVEDALAIDKCTGSTLWVDANAKEMQNGRVSFNTLEDGRNVPHEFQFIECHMIFDIEMEDFHCKAHLVACSLQTYDQCSCHIHLCKCHNIWDCLHCPDAGCPELVSSNGFTHYEHLHHCSMQRKDLDHRMFLVWKRLRQEIHNCQSSLQPQNHWPSLLRES